MACEGLDWEVVMADPKKNKNGVKSQQPVEKLFRN